MSTRPIALLGSEQLQRTGGGEGDSSHRFDGRVGVWRDGAGRMVISAATSPTTTKTATREGIDQSEGSAQATLVTNTREGVDQAESTAPSTLVTETRRASTSRRGRPAMILMITRRDDLTADYLIERSWPRRPVPPVRCRSLSRRHQRRRRVRTGRRLWGDRHSPGRRPHVRRARGVVSTCDVASARPFRPLTRRPLVRRA